jgi:WD40 repeat protein
MMRQNNYRPIQQIKDAHPIRATCFHPSGEAYVVGTNSKALKICRYPSSELQKEILESDGIVPEPEISFTCLHIHCASVYCASFNPGGNLLATGSNDQIVHVIKYNPTRHAPEGSEYKLSMHSGTIRDVCFLHGDESSSGSKLLSAGAGDYEIYLTDCNVMKPIQSFIGHESAVMSLSSFESSPNLFVSGSLDGTVRFWDIRSRNSISTITGHGQVRTVHHSKQPQSQQPTLTAEGDTSFDLLQHNDIATEDKQHHNDECNNDQENRTSETRVVEECQQNLLDGSQTDSNSTGVPVGVVRVDPSGRLLVSGHRDGTCMLFDVRSERTIQSFQAHQDEIRALNFSPNSYYILTGSYDGTVKLTDLQGSLLEPLPAVQVAELADKVVQVAWHPTDYNFVTTCASGNATLWAIPDFNDWRDSIVMDTSVII